MLCEGHLGATVKLSAAINGIWRLMTTTRRSGASSGYFSRTCSCLGGSEQLSREDLNATTDLVANPLHDREILALRVV